MADTDFSLRTSPITMAELDGDCQRYAFLPGHIAAGERVPCPDGDHEHVALSAVHTAVATNVRRSWADPTTW